MTDWKGIWGMADVTLGLPKGDRMLSAAVAARLKFKANYALLW